MPIGLYIHVPFCLSKCPYCDFYSLPLAGDDGLLDRYTASVEQALDRWADRLRTPADTLYFGGGTPSLLGGKRLARLIGRAERCFSLDDAEITLEANPADADGEGGLSETLKAFADAGGTRLSLGMQSASEAELHRLGRRHGPGRRLAGGGGRQTGGDRGHLSRPDAGRRGAERNLGTPFGLPLRGAGSRTRLGLPPQNRG